MDLDSAVAKHAEWKTKFRLAISRKEKMDAATIAKDNCCELGKWLHGEAKSRYQGEGIYREVLTKHAAFHAAAGKVAGVINEGKYPQAESMLGNATEYGAASNDVSAALIRMKKQLAAKA